MIIGIDLGTTNSLASYFSEEGPQIIPNSFGERLTPSVVSVDENGDVFVGKIAKERLVSHPQNTVALFKRSMGSKKEYALGKKRFFPEELSSLIIKKLKQDAEHYLGADIQEAVISVPAYFNDFQRKATKKAGELAGLKVERIVNEPTSAAMAYGLLEKTDACKYLIFDLGGGTFDVSIIDYYKNLVEVQSIAGDSFLGGDDFNKVIVRMFLDECELDAYALDEKQLAIIEKTAERAKREISNNPSVEMVCVLDGVEHKAVINIDDYEHHCEYLFERLKKPLIKALKDASLRVEEIDSVILVGGATKLQLIKKFVLKLFGRMALCHLNPDEGVALGVAIQAAMKERHEQIQEVVLTDVCPFSLGVKLCVRQNGVTQDDVFSPIIERNTTIPTSIVKRVHPTDDFQNEILFKVLQGENRKASENILIGELRIQIKPLLAKDQPVDIRYTYDINGILEVEATVLSTGTKKSIIIEQEKGARTPEEIAERLKILQSLKIHPRDREENRLLMAKAERLYEESLGLERERMRDRILLFESILDRQDKEEIAEFAKRFAEFLSAYDDISYF